MDRFNHSRTRTKQTKIKAAQTDVFVSIDEGGLAVDDAALHNNWYAAAASFGPASVRASLAFFCFIWGLPRNPVSITYPYI
jgi:hypothetical protein